MFGFFLFPSKYSTSKHRIACLFFPMLRLPQISVATKILGNTSFENLALIIPNWLVTFADREQSTCPSALSSGAPKFLVTCINKYRHINIFQNFKLWVI